MYNLAGKKLVTKAIYTEFQLSDMYIMFRGERLLWIGIPDLTLNWSRMNGIVYTPLKVV